MGNRRGDEIDARKDGERRQGRTGNERYGKGASQLVCAEWRGGPENECKLWGACKPLCSHE